MAPRRGVQIRIRGTVQGVGFRPLVWRLAQQHGISGSVCNDAQGVVVEAWGEADSLNAFTRQLEAQPPPLARIDHIAVTPLQVEAPIEGFRIVESRGGASHTQIPTDAATCPECLAELFDPNNRRYRYPFVNCTHCGPRFSIIETMPYDRASTSMAGFAMCPSCEAEYLDPADRRFHAQATCCPECGPRVWLEPVAGNRVEHKVIEQAAQLIGEGKIVAIKGIGGFHIVCDATDSEAVERLRVRKQRPHKPFALMARDLAMVREYVKLGDEETTALQSHESPIVLLEQTSNSLPPALAPNLNTLGFMLPYTPLHHLLLDELQRPLVMTSANRSGELLIADNDEARERLSGIADYFLMHNRAIIHRLDDSVVRVIDGRARMMRRARGYAPTPIKLPTGYASDKNILAMGAEMKGSFCLLKNDEAILSPYMGDLKDATSYQHYRKNIERYCELYDFTPELIAIDKHPDYLSAQWGREIAAQNALPVVTVQHHHAHIATVMAEHGVLDDETKVLGVALDGLGYGDDGTLWGGEFLLADYRSYQRLAHFESIAMPGGKQAIVEPWRNTFAHLEHFIGWDAVMESYADLELVDYLGKKPLSTVKGMIAYGINSPRTSAAGRLFDAVAVALGICRNGISYDGQAAVELEALAAPHIETCGGGYSYASEGGVIRWRSVWVDVLGELKAGKCPGVIAARLHKTVATAVVNVASKLCDEHGVDIIVFAGGAVQNRLLLSLCERTLCENGLEVLAPAGLPGNDGGVAMGQALIASRGLPGRDTLKC